MADSYKNSIQIGIKIDPQNQAQTNLNTIIKKLNENKINLDLTIKGDASKQLENLSTVIDTLKSKMGGGISLGDLDKVINNSVNGLTKLNGELQKVSQTNYSNDGSKKIITETATAIGEVVTQTQKFDKNNAIMGEGIAKTTTNYVEQAKAIKDVEKAQQSLSNLKLVDQNKVADLSNKFTNISANEGKGYSTNELNTYLNQVKVLESEEQNLKQIQNNNNQELEAQYKLQQEDLKQLQKLEQQRVGEIQKENELNTKLNNVEYTSNQTNAYKQLTSLQTEEYSIKEKLITAENIYKQELESRLITINQLKTAEQQNVKNNNLTNQQKELELTNQRVKAEEQLNQAKAKKNDSDTSTIQKESQAYQEEQKQVQTLIQNKIKLLEIEKQSLTRQYGTNIDTTVIDQAIAKLRTLDGISLKDLQTEFRNINTGIKETTEVAKSSETTFDKFKNTLSSFGVYLSGALVFGKMTQELQQGVEWIKYLDESFTDMSVTMDISREQFDKMSVSIDDMSKQLGVNAQDVHDIARVYANASASVDEILSKVKPEAMLSNVSGISGDSITKTVQATTYAFDLLNESESNAGQVTEHIGDLLTNVSAHMKYDFKAGIVGLNDAIRTAGSTAKESGMSLEQFSSYMGALMERTGKTGTELGTFFKTLTARVQQIKTVGDEIGITRKEMSNAEKALTSVGVSVRGQNGAMKDMDSVLKELSTKWGTLNDQERSNVAFGVAGNIHRTTFLSLMKSMTTEQKLYGDALNSTGALEEANDKKAESFQGRLNTLKDTVQVFFDTIISGSALKGGVSLFSNIIGGITNVTKAFGTIPTALTTVIGAMTLFNSKFRESMSAYQPTFLTNWTSKLGTLRTELVGHVDVQKQNISSLQSYIAEQQKAGNSTVGLQGKLVGMQAGLMATSVAEKACAVGAIALQTALSMGVTLAISLAISGLMSLANSSDNAKQKMEELSSSIKSESDSIGQAQELLKQKNDLESQISKTSEGTKENTNLKKQLLDVERQLSDVLPSSTSGFDAEGKAISANTDLIKAQIQAKKDKLAVDAQELLNGTKDVDKSVKEAQLMEKQIESVKLAQKQGNPVATIGVSLDTDETMDVRYTDDYVSREEKRLTELKSTISNVRLAILQLKQAGKSDDEIKTMFPNIDISAINDYSNAIENSTNKTNQDSNVKTQNTKNTKVLTDATNELKNSNGKLSTDSIDELNKAYPNMGINAENAKNKVEELNKTVDSGDDDAVQKATKDYASATQSIAQAEQYLQKLNKAQAVTPTLSKQMQKAYGDSVATIDNVSEAQEFLNKKIEDQKAIQEDTYLTMMGDDQNFYQQKIANNQDFQNAYTQFLNSFNADGEQAYQVDFGNYKSLNELKQGTMSDFGVAVNQWLSQYVDVSASGYNIDLSNFKSIAQAKEAILQVLNEEIQKLNSNLAETEYAINKMQSWVNDEQEGYSDSFDESMSKHLNDNVDTYKSKLGDLNGAVEKVGANFNGIDEKMKGFGSGETTDFGSGDSSGKGSKSKAESEAEKAQKLSDKIAKLQSTEEIDRYADVNNSLTVVNNSLKQNKTLQDATTGKEHRDALTQEVVLYNQKRDAIMGVITEQKKDVEERKTALEQSGFEFDSDGKLINTREKLLALQQQANSMSGNTEGEKTAKEDAIKNVKTLIDKTKEYVDLTNTKIPENINEWEELANTIKKTNEETKKADEDLVTSLQSELANDILADAQTDADTAKTKLASEKTKELKEINDEKTASLESYQAEIDSVQAELDSLNDETSDNETKLAKLKAERALWTKETGNVYAQSKVTSLDSSISDLEKTIKKNDLQSQIDNLNTEKSTASDDYDSQISDLNDYYDKKETALEESNKKLLSEEEAYNKANKLLQEKNMVAIEAELSKHEEKWKTIGSALGTNLGDGISEAITTKVTNAIASVENLASGNSASTSSSSSNSPSTSTNSDLSGLTGSLNTKNLDDSHVYKGTTTTGKEYEVNNKGDVISTVGVSSEELADIKKHIASLSTGGRTPSNIDEGALAMLHSDELVLNSNETGTIDDILSYVKNSGGIISQLSNQYANSNNYSLPSLVGTNLNGIGSNITNTSSNSTTSQSISMPVTIVNEKGSESFTEQKLYKAIDKWQKEQGRKYK